MVKLVFCMKRLPHLSREAFLDYWLNTHGPLMRKHAAAMKVLRYVQHHNLGDPLNEAFRHVRGGPEPFDGVAEVWWESRTDMEAGMSSPEGRAAGKAMLEDEKRFIDLSASPVWLGEEKTIIAG